MTDEEDNPLSDKIVGVPHPKLAKKLIGHSTQKLYFLNSYISGRLPQCWLLAGDKGVGKATFAWMIAKFLLTANQGPDDVKVFQFDFAFRNNVIESMGSNKCGVNFTFMHGNRRKLV